MKKREKIPAVSVMVLVAVQTVQYGAAVLVLSTRLSFYFMHAHYGNRPLNFLLFCLF